MNIMTLLLKFINIDIHSMRNQRHEISTKTVTNSSLVPAALHPFSFPTNTLSKLLPIHAILLIPDTFHNHYKITLN